MTHNLLQRLCILGALIATLAGSSASARELGIELDYATMRLATQSSLRLSRGDPGYGGQGVRVYGEVVPQVAVGAEWWSPEANGGNGGQWSQKLSSEAAIVDGVFRWPLLAWFQPRLRVGAGLAWHTLELEQNGAKFQGSQVTPLLLGTAGFELVVPRHYFQRPGRKAEFTLGMSFDVGWQHLFAADWKLDAQRALSPAMTQKPLDFGTAGLTGSLVRLALLVRF